MTIFETARLRLRRMTRKDADPLFDIFSDPVTMQYYPKTRNREEVDQWIDWTLNNYQLYGVGLWIVENRETGDFLGQCGIVPQTVQEESEWEIGYLFLRQHWGRGYATEAAQACRDYGFRTLEATHLISLINPANTPSIAVAQRNGMHFRERVVWHDKPIHVYTIDRLEWLRLKR